MKKNSSYSGGFTLIELLVVIAIIGILSSIVLVSLNSARNKGKDGRIQEEVSQIRTQLESNNNGTVYTDIGTTTTGGFVPSLPWIVGMAGVTPSAGGSSAFRSVAADIDSQGPSATVGTNLKIFTNPAVIGSSTVAAGYSIYALLNSGGYFCVDSQGGNTSRAVLGTFPTITAGTVNTCQP